MLHVHASHSVDGLDGLDQPRDGNGLRQMHVDRHRDLLRLVVEVTLWDGKDNESVADPVELMRGTPPAPGGSGGSSSNDVWNW